MHHTGLIYKAAVPSTSNRSGGKNGPDLKNVLYALYEMY